VEGSSHGLEGLRWPTENIHQDTLHFGWVSNRSPAEYRWELLAMQITCLVTAEKKGLCSCILNINPNIMTHFNLQVLIFTCTYCSKKQSHSALYNQILFSPLSGTVFLFRTFCSVNILEITVISTEECPKSVKPMSQIPRHFPQTNLNNTSVT
jgi:hypothetical protein